MSFLVTARKYRPQNFQEVIAQKHIINTLLNTIKTGRIAHAYLFSGPRGVGKTTTARIFAKAINCPNAKDGEPCNSCNTCIEIQEGRCIDVIEIDGASNNGVEQVRNIRESVRYVPTREKFKMYIIDEVHMLSQAAFNALLKTLEEPPPHALFVFATTEVHKLPATVISRCQRYDFRRMGIEDIIHQLEFIAATENITIDEEALHTIAKKADGSMRDAQSIFDQVVAFTGSNVTGELVRDVLHVVDQEYYFRLTDLIKSKDTKGGFTLAEEIIMSGFDAQEFLAGLEEHFRNILIAKTTGEVRLIEATEHHREHYMTEASHFSEGDILRLLTVTGEAMQSIKFSTQPRLKFEITLIKMIKMDSSISINDLIMQLESLKTGGRSSGTGAEQTVASQSRQNVSGGYKAMSNSYAAYEPTQATITKVNASAPPLSTGTTLSFDAVSHQWNKFVESVRSIRRTVGMNLEQCHPMELNQGVLRVSCDDDFRYNQLTSSAPILVERFQNFFGTPVKYEFVLSSHESSKTSTYSPAQNSPASSTESPLPPIVQLLIDEFGAEIIR